MDSAPTPHRGSDSQWTQPQLHIEGLILNELSPISMQWAGPLELPTIHVIINNSPFNKTNILQRI